MGEKLSVRGEGGIAYLLDAFLSPTTTFVTREVRYLYSRGWGIQVYVLGPCIKSRIDPANLDLLPIATFNRPWNVREIVLANLLAVIKYPRKYVRTLWQIVRVKRKNPAQCIRAIAHFTEGISVGKRMIDEGITWVHVHFAGRAATAALSIRGVYGIPYSVTTHAYDLFVGSPGNSPSDPLARIESGRRSHTLLNLKLSWAQVILTISEFNYRFLTEKLGIRGEKIQVVRCGVDPSRFQRRTQPANAVPTILSVGGLVEKKGHDVLLRACAHLKEQDFQFNCNIIGGGPLLENLLSLRKSLNIEKYVHFCGRVHNSEISIYFEEADVFVLACVEAKNGNMDGIPVALMEAMVMEIPVVTTNLSGIPELVESGICGFLVDPGDPRALADRIRQLLCDGELRQEMGRRGREKVLQEYDERNNLPVVAHILCNEMVKV